MKEYKISELMKNYTDNEFFVEGEQTVDTEKAVGYLLAQVRPKKRMKPLFKALVAAAAAAAVLAGTAAATGIVIRGGYETSTGMSVSYMEEENHSFWSVHYGDNSVPIKVKEGNRLMFVADGQNIDITDLVDENTPYIYTYENTEGDPCYIIVGGAAGDYGYIDLLPFKAIGDTETIVRWHEVRCNTHVPRDQWIEYPEDITFYDDDEMKEEKMEAYRKAYDEAMRSEFRPWCLAAFDELGVWGSIYGWVENSSDPIALNESFGYVYSSESDVSDRQ